MATKTKLTADLAHKIAGLANLPLTTDEEKLYTSQLSKILDYVDQLSQLPTPGVEPAFNITDLKGIMRQDQTSAEQTLSQNDALVNAPRKENGLFKTEAIISKE